MTDILGSLRGTNAVVIGAGALAGAIADGLHASGCTVAVLGEEPVGDLRHVKAEVTDPDDVARAFGSLDGEFGTLEAAVMLPAPAGCAGPAEEIEASEWDAVLDARLNAVFWCAQQAARRMLPAGRGSIVAVSSLAGVLVDKHDRRAHLHAANAAVDTLARGLAVEWGGRGVRVNTVAPGGLADLPGAGTSLDDVERITAAVPMRRLGTASEVVDIVRFLCSSASAYLTGQTLVADGGRGLLFD